MTTLSKEEIIALAREAGGLPDPMVFIVAYERFATLCRADLVAENERLKSEAMYLATFDCPDDDMFERIDRAARVSFNRHKSSIRGQQITRADAFESHLVWAAQQELRAELSALRAGSGEAVAWLIPDDSVNSLVVESIERLIKTCEAAHMADLKVRINGEDKWFQADWVKYLTRATPQPSAVPVVRELVEALEEHGDAYMGHSHQYQSAITKGQQWLKENTND